MTFSYGRLGKRQKKHTPSYMTVEDFIRKDQKRVKASKAEREAEAAVWLAGVKARREAMLEQLVGKKTDDPEVVKFLDGKRWRYTKIDGVEQRVKMDAVKDRVNLWTAAGVILRAYLG